MGPSDQGQSTSDYLHTTATYQRHQHDRDGLNQISSNEEFYQ